MSAFRTSVAVRPRAPSAWIEPHAHGVLALAENQHVADAGHAFDRVLHINIQIIGDELVEIAPIERIEAGAEDKIGVGLRDGDAG